MMNLRDRSDGLSIVIPSFEKHYTQFYRMIESIYKNCQDIEFVNIIVVVERINQDAFSKIFNEFPEINYKIIITEDILIEFGAIEKPSDFLRRIGKFTFQTLKKFGGLSKAETKWSLVLDSEGLFLKPFQFKKLLEDYKSEKYIFYTETQLRGPVWRESLGFQVTSNAAAALSVSAGDRWYMEYFHWFYETDKIIDLLNNKLGKAFYNPIKQPSYGSIDFFENILYYLYIEKFDNKEYKFFDLKKLAEEFLPEAISRRYNLKELPFSLFGNEYLLNIFSPDEVRALGPLFERFKLPFIRLEPPLFSTKYLDELKSIPSFVATISSHHAVWLRKRIAVCISGEFRHLIHRVPEQQVRHLVGFLSGVDCDVYVHGWSNTSEALIIDQLKPRAYKFESKPSFSSLLNMIKLTEPNIKHGRDEGSLAMFYSIEECYKLLEPNIDDYEYVLRIRPDIYSELSLKEILVKISDEGDTLPETIYFPKIFHSKGINDQIALGPVREMECYAKTFSYIKENIGDIFFNPESVLLRNLIESNVELAVVDMPYALMRNEPIKIGTIHEHFDRQHHVWWSRIDGLPSFQSVTKYFADKLMAMDGLMREIIPELVYLKVPEKGGGHAVIRAQMIDNDPVMSSNALFNRFGAWVWAPFIIESGKIVQIDKVTDKHLFIFNDNSGKIIVSEWRMKVNKFVNEKILILEKDINPFRGPYSQELNVFYGSPEIFDLSVQSHTLFPIKREVLSAKPKFPYLIEAKFLRTNIAHLNSNQLISTANGIFFYGPYVDMAPGHYVAVVHTIEIVGDGYISLSATAQSGEKMLAKNIIRINSRNSNVINLRFDVDNLGVSNFEIVCKTKGFKRISISDVTIHERDLNRLRPSGLGNIDRFVALLKNRLMFAGKF